MKSLISLTVDLHSTEIKVKILSGAQRPYVSRALVPPLIMLLFLYFFCCME